MSFDLHQYVVLGRLKKCQHILVLKVACKQYVKIIEVPLTDDAGNLDKSLLTPEFGKSMASLFHTH
jgi:hypothetical protein